MSGGEVPKEVLDEGLRRIAEGQGCELLNAEVTRAGRSWVLRLTIDKEGGVNLSDCEAVSKEASAWLDVIDVIPQRYSLEVESPGLDRRLFREADYVRFAGRRVTIKLTAALNGQRVFHGTLQGIEDGIVSVVAADGKKTYTIPFGQISVANLQVEI